MTREEAINILRNGLISAPTEHDWCIAFQMAIESLEQESCEDCISRKELLKAIDTWDKFGCDANTKLVPYKDHYIPYIHYDDVIKCIKGMPSVKQEQKVKTDVLEQIKAELKSKRAYFLLSHHDYAVAYGLEVAMDIIDEVIKEVS